MRAGTMQSSALSSNLAKADWHIDPGALLGSWQQTVKKGDGGEEDDPLSTIEALRMTKQNFYIYSIDTDTQWLRLTPLLKAACGGKIKIFAAMNSPYQDNSRSRWFGSSGVPVTPAATYEEVEWQSNRDNMLIWLDAWVTAATALSHLSLGYPDTLVGFVINDFEAWIESADYPAGMDGTRL